MLDPSRTRITPERPDTTDARALIAELEAQLEPLYPSESRHGYAVEKLIAQGVAFFVIRHDGAAGSPERADALVRCGTGGG